MYMSRVVVVVPKDIRVWHVLTLTYSGICRSAGGYSTMV